jgi:hypothetical protein
MRLTGIFAKSAFFIFFVFLEVPFKPFDMTFIFKSIGGRVLLRAFSSSPLINRLTVA